MKPFFVYMLRCRDGSYYVGHTDDLEKRMAEHHEGTFGGHAARKRPLALVWCHDTASRAEALERELQLKRWTRAKKAALIAEDWAGLKSLARGLDRHVRERMHGVSSSPFDSAPGTGSAADASGRYAQGERGSQGDGRTPGAHGARGDRATRGGPAHRGKDSDRA